jgi:hypothetical protein
MNTEPDYMENLKRLRDEIQLKIHLGSMELKDEWERLDKKWDEFVRKAQFEKTAADLNTALENLAAELQKGYERLKKAL